MGLCQVVLFISYLCLLQCGLYEGRAFERENTVVRMQIPLSYLTLFSGPLDGETAPPANCKGNCQNGQKTPSAVVLSLPAGSKKRKTNIIVDMPGKNNACQYVSGGQTKNETLNVEVFVNDKHNNGTVISGDGNITTSSNSSVEDGKDGIKVIGSSISTTPNSNLTVFVNVYLMDKQGSDKTMIMTNSSIVDDKGNSANADTGAGESSDTGSGSGTGGNKGSKLTITKSISSSGGTSSDGTSTGGSTSDGTSTGGSSSNGTSSDGMSSGGSSTDDGSGGSGDDTSSGGDGSGGSGDDTSSGGDGSSDDGSSGNSDDGSSDGGSDKSSDGGKSGHSAAAAASAGASASKDADGHGGSAAGAAGAAVASSKHSGDAK